VVVQTAVLVAAALAGRRLSARIAALEAELRAATGPTFSRLARVAENAEEVSERLARGLPQLEEAIEGAAANVRRANQIFDVLESALLAPLRPLARGLAFWRRLRGAPEPERVRLLESDDSR
jgi:ABC-type transporter Mla subunit MlaD